MLGALEKNWTRRRNSLFHQKDLNLQPTKYHSEILKTVENKRGDQSVYDTSCIFVCHAIDLTPEFNEIKFNKLVKFHLT